MEGDGAQPRTAVQDRGVHDRLDSWKEIAAYLKREVRTVQRWEKNLRLPVRRLAHQKGPHCPIVSTQADTPRSAFVRDLSASASGQQVRKLDLLGNFVNSLSCGCICPPQGAGFFIRRRW